MTRALALLLALGLVLAGCSDVPHAGQPARTQLTSTDVGADSQPDEAGQEAASENRQQPPERASGQRSAKDLEQTATREGITKAKVIRVVDGDTIEVQYIIGSVLPATRVRMIGVDTPEVHGQKEPYGPEASEFTKRQLTGRTVWLEKDVSETDRYGRVLRYVWLIDPPADPTETQIREGLFNAILVLKGYAQVATYPMFGTRICS